MEAKKMTTTNVSFEFKKNNTIVGMESSKEYKHNYINTDDPLLTRKYVGTEFIQDWFIYIVPYLPLHVHTVKKYD
jgi:hypothetical protein